MSTNPERLKNIIEGAMLAAGRPLSIDHMLSLFLDDEQPSRDEVRAALEVLSAECEQRGIELKEVASGFRFQVKTEYAEWVSRLWDEKPARYSRATLETLALIAYRQPITRSEIEEIRGVSVSSNIVKGLLEREWVKIVGHRDVPGKPALFATTRQFLDYFNLKGLSDLPPLAEIRSIDSIERELNFGDLVQAANQGQDDAAPDGTSADGDESIGTAALDLGDLDEAATAVPAENANAELLSGDDAVPVADANTNTEAAELTDATVDSSNADESAQADESSATASPSPAILH